MAITPQTELKLLKVPINIDERNQLTFANATSQYNYFNGLTNKLEVDNFTYQRADGIIRYPAHIDSIINYNYCMYQNENYTNKWFYAFITGMRYINDNMTEISIKTDVYQTWMFDIDVKASYVEREHVNDDTVGKNTYPENLETGEYEVKERYYIGDYPISGTLPQNDDPGYYAVFATSWNPFYHYNTSTQKYEGRVATGEYGGVPQGAVYLIMQTFESCREFLNAMAYQGKNDAIVGCFIVPRSLFYHENNTIPQPIPNNWWEYIKYGDGTFAYSFGFQYLNHDEASLLHYEKSIVMKEYEIYPATSLFSYTPKNNKLLCYPYSYIEAGNNNGISVIYRPEEFDISSNAGNGKIYFREIGVPSPGCSIKLYPKYYKKLQENEEEGLQAGKLPICSYSVDMYTNWLTQNSLSMNLNVAESVVGGVISIAQGNVSGIASAGFGIAETLVENEKHKMIPPQVQGNINNGDVEFASVYSRFTVYQKCIKQEYAEKIDNYFTMFGYKVNITKVPNIYGRTYFNYVKTIDVNIEGYIPQGDLQEIKDMFNNGVTFWHDPSHFLDYNVSNTIVS